MTFIAMNSERYSQEIATIAFLFICIWTNVLGRIKSMKQIFDREARLRGAWKANLALTANIIPFSLAFALLFLVALGELHWACQGQAFGVDNLCLEGFTLRNLLPFLH